MEKSPLRTFLSWRSIGQDNHLYMTMKNVFTYLLLAFLLPLSSYGATFHFSNLQNIPQGGEGVVVFSVDTLGEKINAVSGEIVVPGGVEIQKIITGGSVIVLWLEKPTLSGNKIVFSGMTPGGFQGDKELFSLVVMPTTLYPVPFTLSALEAYRNDEEGTAVRTTAKTFVLRPSYGDGTEVVFDDVLPPEDFVPVIATDPALFEGKPFVSFVAQDKGVGIARYEWASSYLFSPDGDDWRPAESPLLLSRSLLWQKIHIRAIDELGNTTTVSIGAKRHYALIWFGGIILLLVLCVLFSFARPSSYRSS